MATHGLHHIKVGQDRVCFSVSQFNLDFCVDTYIVMFVLKTHVTGWLGTYIVLMFCHYNLHVTITILCGHWIFVFGMHDFDMNIKHKDSKQMMIDWRVKSKKKI